MDRVVYLLGAGFSAPLGLPVMRNFLTKSKDMYASDQVRFSHFREVFDYIQELSQVKNYYEANLFNIEEILSILEMRNQIGGKKSRRFVRLILDVINYYTPTSPRVDPSRFSANWYEYPLSDHPRWAPYFYMAMSLLNVHIEMDNTDRRFCARRDHNPPARYSVLTLNYDRALETWSQFLTSCLPGGGDFVFDTGTGATSHNPQVSVPLAKLHGSVDTQQIIAPTWNKAVARSMAPVWQRAHDLLKEANYIRVIGYSLPVADAYIKYLLKAAVIDSPNLKGIDVICRDQTGTTRARYHEFVTFTDARFAEADVLQYLAYIRQETIRTASIVKNDVTFNKLEVAHQSFFDERGAELRR